MKIAIMGTGTVGQTIGGKLISLGHEVMMGSRTRDNNKAQEFVAKYGEHASMGTFGDAAAFAELIFNCTAGMGTLQAFGSCLPSSLENKIIIDLANALDFSKGMPPTLSIVNNTSLGEELQQLCAGAKVVKALNTMWCGLMVDPLLVNGGDHDAFICGNDADAKQQVTSLLQTFGWEATHIIDLGDITKSRGTEMFLPLWLSIYASRGNAAFNVKIV